MHCYLHTAFTNDSRTKINYLQCETFLSHLCVYIRAGVRIDKKSWVSEAMKKSSWSEKTSSFHFLSFHVYRAKNILCYILYFLSMLLIVIYQFISQYINFSQIYVRILFYNLKTKSITNYLCNSFGTHLRWVTLNLYWQYCDDVRRVIQRWC